MTELETDLRTMLIRKAMELDPDSRAGELTITHRLEHGDLGLDSTAPVDQTHQDRYRDRRTPALTIIAAAALTVIVVAAVALRMGGTDDTVHTTTIDPQAWIEPVDLPGFFGAPGRIEPVMKAYVMSRFGNGPIAWTIQRTGGAGGLTAVRWWYWEDTPEGDQRHAGTVHLRPWPTEAGEGWDVVLTTTDGLLIDDLTRTTSGVRGTIKSDGPDQITVMLTDIEGNPVAPPSAIAGEGPAEGRLLGSAPIRFDLQVPPDRATSLVLRIQHIDGPWLSLTEIRLDP